MNQVVVTISGEITQEYEGGLYHVIDSTLDEFGIEADRDAVIDVFDVVGYYTNLNHNDPHLNGWVKLFRLLLDHKGLTNVSLTIEEDES